MTIATPDSSRTVSLLLAESTAEHHSDGAS